MASWNGRVGSVLGVLVLCACAAPSVRQPPAPGTYPLAVPFAGDWFVYAVSRTSGQVSASEHTMTRYFQTVSGDGALTRLDSHSVASPITRIDFDGDGAMLRTESESASCRIEPPLRLIPAKGSSPGDSFSTVATETCTTKANQASRLRAMSALTKNERVEQVSLPLGTFQTFKYSQIRTMTTAKEIVHSTESCWVDMVMGRTVECVVSYNAVPVGMISPSSRENARFWLVAYRFRGQSMGDAVRRFSGRWRARIAPEGSGVCADLRVDAVGRITGECVVHNARRGEQELTAADGAVNAAGEVLLRLNNGTQVSGKFTSPVDGSGVWALEGVSGTWTARHL